MTRARFGHVCSWALVSSGGSMLRSHALSGDYSSFATSDAERAKRRAAAAERVRQRAKVEVEAKVAAEATAKEAAVEAAKAEAKAVAPTMAVEEAAHDKLLALHSKLAEAEGSQGQGE